MNIGVPKEIKSAENRVAATPAGVKAFIDHGHRVFVEKGAGIGSGFRDEEYVKAGARILENPEDIWGEADMIIKVKEPIGPEFDRMRPGQILFTYLHLAADRELTQKLLECKIVGVAYETVQLDDGSLPLVRYLHGRGCLPDLSRTGHDMEKPLLHTHAPQNISHHRPLIGIFKHALFL